jgi:hypothetical protein
MSCEVAIARIPLTPCGLNASWSVPAWHIGPSKTPNLEPHDYYLIDLEEDGTFAVVMDGMRGLGYVLIGKPTTLKKAIALAKALKATFTTP